MPSALPALSALVALLLAAAPPAHAFQVFRHSSMTDEVLTRQGVTGNTLSFIKQGVRWPDLIQCLSGCYCPAVVQLICTDPDSNAVRQFSVSHYDNNMIAQSMANVDLLMGLARSGLTRPSPPANDEERRRVGVALMFFGEALHAIQDFYAHSTWVELNHDLVRIGGRIDSAPLWNGEDNWGTGTADVGGVTVAGVQTGSVDLPTPAGSVTHDALNKDHANTPQGQKVVNRIFPFGLIGSYYEIASGQNGPAGGSYKDTGLAPRHTIKAWQCLLADCAVYNLPPGPASGALDAAATLDIPSLLAWVDADAGMAAAAQRIDSLWNGSDPDSPSTFPHTQFDGDGWPLPANVSVGDPVRPVARVLDRAWPNPFRGRIAIRFRAPQAGRARLDVFDAAGRRVRTVLDQHLEPGWKDVVWNGHDAAGLTLPSGTYLCRLEGFGRVETCALTLVR